MLTVTLVRDYYLFYLGEGHEVIAVTRDKKRFDKEKYHSDNLISIEYDFLNPTTHTEIPVDVDVAYYLIHSLSSIHKNFKELEAIAAENFVKHLNTSKARQIIYLSGISNSEKLSQHLSSRRNVELILKKANAKLTVFRAAIIVGSGSASFEIIRDLVEKLPFIIAPKWLNNRIQPIAIRNVIDYLNLSLLKEECYGKTFDIGGPEILTYKLMLKKFAEVRKLNLPILIIPTKYTVIRPFWLSFITSTSYKLTLNLVNSMKHEIICHNDDIRQVIPVDLIDYQSAIERAFLYIRQNHVVSSWKDGMTTSNQYYSIGQYIEVPKFGCFKNHQRIRMTREPALVLDNIWCIGGERGWYYANWLWKIRGFIDKLVGGVGLRRGRTNANEIEIGDALDFWRVIYAHKEEKRMLLFAEMKLPGEAWLEFRISEGKQYLEQIATFRPRGFAGRLYWNILLPIHVLIFRKMVRRLEMYRD